jgi:hypothetical protein
MAAACPAARDLEGRPRVARDPANRPQIDVFSRAR